jgi:hypothetical protein
MMMVISSTGIVLYLLPNLRIFHSCDHKFPYCKFPIFISNLLLLLFIFNCSCVDTRRQQYSTRLHTNSTAVQYTFTHKQYSCTVHIYTQTVQQYSTHLHTNRTAVQYTFTQKQYSSTVHIYTQTVDRIHRTEHT